MLCFDQAWLCSCLVIIFLKPFAASSGHCASSAALSIFSAKLIFPSLASSFLFRAFFLLGFLSVLLPAPFFKECLLPFDFLEIVFIANFPFTKGLVNFPFDKGFAFIDVLAFGAILCDCKRP